MDRFEVPKVRVNPLLTSISIIYGRRRFVQQKASRRGFLRFVAEIALVGQSIYPHSFSIDRILGIKSLGSSKVHNRKLAALTTEESV